jgi:hypothetical protein
MPETDSLGQVKFLDMKWKTMQLENAGRRLWTGKIPGYEMENYAVRKCQKTALDR